MKKLSIIFLISFVGFLLYLEVLKKPSAKLFCKRQIDFKHNNFNQALLRGGADRQKEENDSVKKFLVNLYNECLKHELSDR